MANQVTSGKRDPLDSDVLKHRFEQRENALLARIDEGKTQLIAEGQPITLKAIYRRVGVSRTKLMYHPRVREALKTISPAQLGFTD